MERKLAAISVLILSCLAVAPLGDAQSLGNAGTIEGTILDPSGAAVPKADVTLSNPVTGYKQSTVAGPDGAFKLGNIPPNTYRLEVAAQGFSPYSQDLAVRNAVPVQVNPTLAIAGATTSVTVAAAATALENAPSAHTDVDRNQMLKMPEFDPAAGLSQAITMGTGGVAADANGMFHPVGDHSQTSFVIDGQPISDQQSKIFSTQIPESAVQSMEIATGTPDAEFGDKTSLVAQITTRSGLGAKRPFGSIESNYGSFDSGGGTATVGFGSARLGNFLTLDGSRSGRFLDTPEFTPFHDAGNNQTIFDHFDYQPGAQDIFHLNLFAARNWIQIPNDYDQLAQDQRQRVLTWNIAPGYQHTFSARTLLTVNPYIRKDQFSYYPSRNPFNDFPATQSSQRQLLNWGLKADVATSLGRHTIKYGIDFKQTRLLENFGFGITDPGYNSPCIAGSGLSVPDPGLTDPAQCAAAGFQPNIAANPNATIPFSPGLLPFDLSRGGTPLAYHATGNVNQYAFFGQDDITAGQFLVTAGFRLDRYAGLSSITQPEPRLGVSYNVKGTGTVLRAAYARTMETPFNENLLLSSATGMGGLAQNLLGAVGIPIQPGFRNQFNTGLQQALGKHVLLDADYFWKYTHGAFDYNVLLNSTITLPIEWRTSKLDGVTGRVSTTNIKGFQAYWTFGHTRARYFPPETGGLAPQGVPLTSGVFRIDHDQAFQSTLNLRYQRPKNAEWISFVYRFDSGMVVSGVPDAGAALTTLTPNQQVTIGLACNGVYATLASPLNTCVGPGGSRGVVTSSLLTLPQGGYAGFPSQENDDHNPDRVKPRNVIHIGIGTDNLLHSEGPRRYTASIEVANLTNNVALYNFLSTFSGTHFLTPRTVVAKIGFVF